MILESGSDAHWSEDKDISAQSNSDTDIDTGDTTDTNCTQWKDSTNCPTVPVVQKFTGGSSGLWQTEALHINKNSFAIERFHALLFCNYNNSWWKRQIDIITSTWTCWMKDGPQCLKWQFRTCVCFWQLLCRWGTIRGICWKITSQQQNSASWPFTEANLKKTWLKTK